MLQIKMDYTALMYVVRYNYVWLAKILIKAGVDVNAQDARWLEQL
jgi:hypothetical protein